MIVELLFALVANVAAGANDNMNVDSWLPQDFLLRNFGQHVIPTPAAVELPIVVPPFEERVRVDMPSFPVEGPSILDPTMLDELAFISSRLPKDLSRDRGLMPGVKIGEQTWTGDRTGLFYSNRDVPLKRHGQYGINGPSATDITALGKDSRDTLYVGTSLGLSTLNTQGEWRHISAQDGLPVEHITALGITESDDVWLGTPKGAVLYRPYAEGRKWFYFQGTRYLPSDNILFLVLASENKAVYFVTDDGVSRLDIKTTTLLEKAQTIERILNERHRRLGLVAACNLDPNDPTKFTIHDNDNDGLWTAYHVAAMSLAYGATKDEAAKASARESMHALYMLQDASGIPGLVARSVLPAEEGKKKGKQWQPTPEGTMYWKSDTSSDEIDGHYLAFYTYFEHIAQHDPEERARIVEQVREVTDYIVDNGYQLIDYDGKRTRWGFWNPQALNHDPMNWIEMGLNSLQILSFLKTAYYVTGEEKYETHFRKLILEHGYLDNVQVVKKAFPLENNHSDDQLGFVAWYPILQLERDPKVRQALLRGVKYHYDVVRPEQPSFYTFAYATINPGDADLLGAVENLRQIPTDRRNYRQTNEGREDVEMSPHPNRFGDPVLTRVVPADERHFEKWNADPYEPNTGGDGNLEDDGAAYLLPYWMGRYHGFIAEQN